MTTHDHDPPDDTGQRPSWLVGRCPPWCTRRHAEQDHPEDRLHQDDGVVVPVVVADPDPRKLRQVERASEIVLRRFREVDPTAVTWVAIREAEGVGVALTVSEESASRLGDVLAGE